jgi:hypothetical protein
VKIYDFSLYAKRRALTKSAAQVKESMEKINEPNMPNTLRGHVETWFSLHQEVQNLIKKAG